MFPLAFIVSPARLGLPEVLGVGNGLQGVVLVLVLVLLGHGLGVGIDGLHGGCQEEEQEGK